MHDTIHNLRQTQHLLLEKVNLSFKRFLYDQVDFSQRLIGIVGPRGVGKTTLILQYLKEHFSSSDKALYILADAVLLKRGDLLQLAQEFYLKEGGELLCIDEIHRYEHWNQELKNIYDTLPELKVIFSGSSSLNLVRGKYDLSRRGVLYRLPGFSFREFLVFEKGMTLPAIDFSTLLKRHQEISKRMPSRTVLKFFGEYLTHGYYPFFTETNHDELYYQQILTTIDKVIYEDIASMYELKTQNLVTFRKLLSFLATMQPGEININKLAQSVGKNHATVTLYLEMLQDAGVVRLLPVDRAGHALIRSAQKVFLDNPNLLQALSFSLGKQVVVGTLRELFVLNQLQNAGKIPTSTREADVSVDGALFEIGGKHKTSAHERMQGIYLVLDDVIIGDSSCIPLYVFGFLY